MIQHRANLDAKTDANRTAIYWAASYNRSAIVTALISAGKISCKGPKCASCSLVSLFYRFCSWIEGIRVIFTICVPLQAQSIYTVFLSTPLQIPHKKVTVSMELLVLPVHVSWLENWNPNIDTGRKCRSWCQCCYKEGWNSSRCCPEIGPFRCDCLVGSSRYLKQMSQTISEAVKYEAPQEPPIDTVL